MAHDSSRTLGFRSTFSTLLLMLTVLALMGCDDMTPTDTGNEIQYRDDTLRIPNAEIVVNGEVFDGVASIPDTTELVGIVRGEEVFLWHPRLGNAELSPETSQSAIAHFVVGGIGSLQTSSVTEGPTKTGLTVHTADPLTLRNDTSRWHGVVKPGERFRTLDPGRSFQTGIRQADLTSEVAVELYGSVYWGMAVPVAGFYETLSKFQDAVGQGADVEAFAYLGLIEFVEVAGRAVSFIAGFRVDDCMQAFLGSYMVAAFTEGFAAIATGGDTAQNLKDLLAPVLIGAAGPALSCISDSLLKSGTKTFLKYTFRVVSLIIDLFIEMKFVYDKAMSAHDVFKYAAYDVVRIQPLNGEGGGEDSPLCDNPYSEDSWRRATAADVRTCLSYGLDPNDGLFYALQYSDDVGVLLALLNGGADANINFFDTNDSYEGEEVLRPLHIAAGYTNNPAVIRALVAWRGDINAVTHEGLAPLDIAWSRSGANTYNAEVVEAIVAAGGRCNLIPAQLCPAS